MFSIAYSKMSVIKAAMNKFGSTLTPFDFNLPDSESWSCGCVRINNNAYPEKKSLTCGLVVVTLDVERSMTVPPGDVCGPFI